MGYADFRNTNTPPWLADEPGLAWNEAFGNVEDEQLARMKASILARFPDYVPRTATATIAHTGNGAGTVALSATTGVPVKVDGSVHSVRVIVIEAGDPSQGTGALQVVVDDGATYPLRPIPSRFALPRVGMTLAFSGPFAATDVYASSDATLVPDDDALARLGQMRRIRRGPREPSLAYMARLVKAFDAWAWAGTPFGVATYALAPAGFPNARIMRNADWRSVSCAHTGSGTGAVYVTGSAPGRVDGDGVPVSPTHTIVVSVTGSGNPAASSGSVTVALDGGAAVTLSPIPASCKASSQLTIRFSGAFVSGDGYTVTTTTAPPDGAWLKWCRTWWVVQGHWERQLWGHNPDGSVATYTWGHNPACPRQLWGSTASVDDYEAMRQLLKDWSPAHERIVGVFVTAGPSLRLYGDGSLYDGSFEYAGQGEAVFWPIDGY